MHSLSVPKENKMEIEKKIDEELKRMMITYGDEVLRISYMYLKNIHKAEDAFQEVFIKIYNNYKSFKGNSSEKTWIIKITINVCKDILRSAWLKRVFLTDKVIIKDGHLDTESLIINKDENRRLFNEVVSLSTVFKEVIILYYYQGFDTAEISKILNIAEGTVRSRLYRARKKLKNKIGGRINLSE